MSLDYRLVPSSLQCIFTAPAAVLALLFLIQQSSVVASPTPGGLMSIDFVRYHEVVTPTWHSFSQRVQVLS